MIRPFAVCCLESALCRGDPPGARARLMSRNQKRDLALRHEIKRQRLIVRAGYRLEKWLYRDII